MIRSFLQEVHVKLGESFGFICTTDNWYEVREVVKKTGSFTVRLTVKVDPPPPSRNGQVICDFFLRDTLDFGL